MIWFINKKERTWFRANGNEGEQQLERTDLRRTDSSELVHVDRANDPDTLIKKPKKQFKYNMKLVINSLWIKE